LSALIKNQDLSEEFLSRVAHKISSIDWCSISKKPGLSEDIMFKFKDDIWWSEICKYQKLSEPFMEKMAEYIDWHLISLYQDLTEDFIKKHLDKFRLEILTKKQKLSTEFIDSLSKKDLMYVNFAAYITNNQDIITREFVEKYDDYIPWTGISRMDGQLTEDFMRKFADKLEWEEISATQKLSKEFIEEFKDKLDWDILPYYQFHLPSSWLKKKKEEFSK
jgi:hypothetical protein